MSHLCVSCSPVTPDLAALEASKVSAPTVNLGLTSMGTALGHPLKSVPDSQWAPNPISKGGGLARGVL